ncbi:2-hydroxycarboxylate transporter family protein [Enterocloster lavalensis]|uniref:2-hydroxycarboxylate transporter family protein n=1 Tax=Enterocloster lavalensis TaxID=460384 RepID=UPI0023EF9299|nr:2-hydroxycarboxylate transporter family protein [Enterocloster lavalensis]
MGNQLKNSSVGFFPMKYFLVLLVITVLGIMTGTSCEGFLGGFVVCTVLGLFMMYIGDALPIVNTYFGGGSFIALFGSAALVYFGIFPEATIGLVSDFCKNMDYNGWLVGALICGSILAMDRKLLLRAGILYFIPIVLGIACAFGMCGLVGALTGYGWREAILFIALPIMGGGTAAGAVPTAATYGMSMTKDSAYYLSLMMPAVVMGNALAIVVAGLLNGVGLKFPKTTGNGKLMKKEDIIAAASEKMSQIDFGALGRGFVLTGIFYTLGKMCALAVPGIHYYAWTIILCAVCKISGIVPEQVQEDVKQWYQLVMKIGIPAILITIGVVYVDLDVVIANLNLGFVLMVLATLIGCVIGPWLIAGILGFNKVEIAMTAGLCMANMGGSGDVATLGAGKRMELMPFAQISSRIGGALIIVLASIIAPIIGAGL